MSIVLQVVLIIGTVAFLLAVLRSVRHGHLDLKYSLLWLLLGVLLLLCAIFPGIVVFFTGLLGIGLPSNFVFMAGLLCTLVICMSLTRIVSGQDRKIRSLIQHVSLLEKRLADADRAAAPRPAPALPPAAEAAVTYEREPEANEDEATVAEPRPEQDGAWANEELAWGVSASTAEVEPAVESAPEPVAAVEPEPPLSGVATTGSWEALPHVEGPAAAPAVESAPEPVAAVEPESPLSGVATTGSWEALPHVEGPAAAPAVESAPATAPDPTPEAGPKDACGPDENPSLPPFLRKQ